MKLKPSAQAPFRKIRSVMALNYANQISLIRFHLQPNQGAVKLASINIGVTHIPGENWPGN